MLVLLLLLLLLLLLSWCSRLVCSAKLWYFFAMLTLFCLKATVEIIFSDVIKVSKGAKIRSRYNQVPHPTQDTNGKVTNSQLDTLDKAV